MILYASLCRWSPAGSVVDELGPRLAEALAAIPGLWASGKTAVDAQFRTDPALGMDILDIPAALAAETGGAIHFRGGADDDLGHDVLELNIDTKRADYRDFCHSIFPQVIAAFGPYRGQIATDLDVVESDGPIVLPGNSESWLDLDGRDGIFRIWPVTYFDDAMSRRCFGIEAAEAVRRAAPVCERAELIAGGAYLLVTSDLVVGKRALNRLSVRVASRLTPWRGLLFRVLSLGWY